MRRLQERENLAPDEPRALLQSHLVEETIRVTGWVTLADLSRALLLGGDALQTSLKRLTEEA
jgi:hypothetical protein